MLRYNTSCVLCIMFSPPGKISLMGLVSRFPQLNPTVVRTYFELLLFTEVSSKHITSTAVTVAAFFPTWLRGALKKGAFKVLNVAHVN